VEGCQVPEAPRMVALPDARDVNRASVVPLAKRQA
jgi:hypothetical protein